VGLDRTATAMGLLDQYYTSFLDMEDTAAVISAEAAAASAAASAAAAVDQHLANTLPDTAGYHPALPELRMVVVLNSHTRHNWGDSAVELSRMQNFHFYLSAAVIARSALSADKIFVALGSRL
jgi:hypothetical protein